MSIGEIIRKRRIEKGMTLEEVSGLAECSKPYLSTIETRKVKNPPSEQLLQKLENILSFEAGQLIQIARMERLPEELRRDIETSQAENFRLKQILRQFLDDPNASKHISDMITGDIVLDHERTTLNSTGLIPVINKVAAGYPAEFNDLDYPAGIADDYVRCPDLRDPNAFAVRVVGDSMEPNYSQGDIVVFSPALEIRMGDDCFVRFAETNETTFKRVFFEQDGRVRLQPRNEKYSPIFVDGEKLNGIYRAAVRYQII